MLILIHTPKFRKRFNALSEKLKRKTLDRLLIFVVDEYNSILNNHQLHGEYKDCRSINISGDVRLIYKSDNDNERRIIAIGTHNQLYE